MPRTKIEDGPYETPQITLRGRNAMVVQKLAGIRERGIPEAATWIIDQWISGEGRKQLLDIYGIDVRDRPGPSNVVQMSDKQREGISLEKRLGQTAKGTAND